ncbi:hypothetical protein FRC02_000999 [Tulasnella sp. 418]|nr:hypothetical protein FRC02_000999 [Tulasnella sp. 418]
MSQLNIQLVAPVVIGLGAYAISRISKIGSRDYNLPPGPPTVPILGNLAIMPVKDTYLKFTEWARTYGGVYSLKVGPQTIIVVTSIEAINELMEKNGAITADKPPFEPARRIGGPTGVISFTPYGNLWRKMRKAAVEVMKPSARKQNRPIQKAEINQLLFDIQENPENIYYHIQRSSISSLFAIVGGMRIPQADSPMRNKFFHAWEMTNEVLQPGNAPPVDLLPILNYIPDSLVGNWKARCATIERMISEIIRGMVDDVESRLKDGQTVGCHLELMMQNAKEWDLSKEEIIGVTTALVIAGTVTSTSMLQFIVFLAAAFPEYQRKVQEELDRVVGTDRSPTIDDISCLPTLKAFIREVHRFRTITPLGLPHLTQEDQWYQGQLIPKGSNIIYNTWGALHDPDLYDHPHTFDPDRFLRSPYGTKVGIEEKVSVEALKRLETLPFGVGRRRCAGMPMANDSIAVASANLFWAFEFGHFVDDNGTKIETNLESFNVGLSNDPLPFKCKVKTRADRQIELIKQNYAQSTPIFEQFERELSQSDREYVGKVRAGLRAFV